MQPTGMTPPQGVQDGVPPSAQPPMDPVMMFRYGIRNLSPEELRELDQLLTPRIVELVCKMFGSQMQQTFEPWIKARKLLAVEPEGTA